MYRLERRSSFYLKEPAQQAFHYKKHRTHESGGAISKFHSVDIFHNYVKYKSAIVTVDRNLMRIANNNMMVDLVNLYLVRVTAKIIELKQKSTKLTLVFKSKREAARFIESCGNFVVRQGIWIDFAELKKLDSGGFSTVLLAKKKDNSGELVAVKAISKKMDEKSYRYLQMELFALRNLTSPNALELFNVYEDDLKIYLVTEFLNGGHLAKRLEKKDISEGQSIDVVKALLNVIIEMNKYDLVHRDIKPANIMFHTNSEGKEICKLIDFGLCADLTDRSDSTLLKDKSGTVCYLAPELVGWEILKQLYDRQVDVFSIGMILFEM